MTASPSTQDQLAALFAIGRVIPVTTLDRVADAVPLARALVAGGVRLLEITLRTQAGLEGARAIIREVSEAVVGIGTVLTPDDMKRAVDVGARFALSPGATPALLDAAAASRIPFLPGIATASEVMEAMAAASTQRSSSRRAPPAAWPCCGRWPARSPRRASAGRAASRRTMPRSGWRSPTSSRSAAPG